MVRRRLAEATKETVETLHSIIKLVNDLPNMRVGKDVQRGVRSALAELAAVRLPPPSLPQPADRMTHSFR